MTWYVYTAVIWLAIAIAIPLARLFGWIEWHWLLCLAPLILLLIATILFVCFWIYVMQYFDPRRP